MTSLIEFKLFAPYNKDAAVIGSFSDWEPVEMQKGDDGYFRTKIELEDGEYEYKFRVRSKSWFLEEDEWVDIVDPYAIDIAPPTQNGILRIKDGQKIVDTYVWHNDDKPLPSDHELVIYELHISDFSGGEDDPKARGKYQHVIEKEHYDENLDIKPAWQYIGDTVDFWIGEYHIDGIRYDAARQIDNYDFMHWIVKKAKTQKYLPVRYKLELLLNNVVPI